MTSLLSTIVRSTTVPFLTTCIRSPLAARYCSSQSTAFRSNFSFFTKCTLDPLSKIHVHESAFVPVPTASVTRGDVFAALFSLPG
ncbi:hypothetical protein PF011_g29888 [Phytophthora fragariae]|uniref:Uncharacterized protein n=1 Tax=Phytophthora fragariae TaxID=53985 RepID=A0A6A3GVD5_9STRA|nr:hypothetical protein PF011_g29888 [Phytophthora fragariae]